MSIHFPGDIFLIKTIIYDYFSFPLTVSLLILFLASAASRLPSPPHGLGCVCTCAGGLAPRARGLPPPRLCSPGPAPEPSPSLLQVSVTCMPFSAPLLAGLRSQRRWAAPRSLLGSLWALGMVKDRAEIAVHPADVIQQSGSCWPSTPYRRSWGGSLHS